MQQLRYKEYTFNCLVVESSFYGDVVVFALHARVVGSILSLRKICLDFFSFPITIDFDNTVIIATILPNVGLGVGLP